MRRFDISKTFPTTIEPYFVLNVCDHKGTPDLDAILDVDRPTRAALKDLTLEAGRPYYRFRSTEIDRFKAKSETLKGREIWIDPQIRESLFLSDRLAKSITMAGFAKDRELVRCEVVGAA